jgi:hypothetical protein
MLTYRRPGEVLALLLRGLMLFDLPHGSRKARPGWQERSTGSVDQVMAWMRAGHNLGVGCRASEVAVLDLDQHPFRPSGLLMFSDLCRHYGVEWPATLTSVTPRGQHLFFRMPAGRVVLSLSGPRSPLGPGIDVRGPGRKTGGYVVAPGSVVPAGEYRILRDHPIADLPTWLADTIAEPEEV